MSESTVQKKCQHHSTGWTYVRQRGEERCSSYIKAASGACTNIVFTQLYPVTQMRIREGWAGMCAIRRTASREEGRTSRESQGWKTEVAGKIREGGTHEREYKSKDNKKCTERFEQGEREKDRRGSTWRTAGPGSWGQAQEAVAQSMSSFHLVCCRCSNINFTQI